jgi:lipopolysaccharide/colanic/teichoic acid biosynthesis glycosyltransferase
MELKNTRYVIIDSIIVSVVFSVFLLMRTEPFTVAVQNYFYSYLIFLGIWILISLLSNKFMFQVEQDLYMIVRQILVSNLLVLGTATTLMYLIRVDYYSRIVLFGTISSTTLIELIWATLIYYIRNAVTEPPDTDKAQSKQRVSSLRRVLGHARVLNKKVDFKTREDAILVEISQEAYDFIFTYADIESVETLIISTTSRFNIDTQLKEKFNAIVNLKRLNDIRYINKFFESANTRLPAGGYFIDFVETKDLRKKRILKKFPAGINYVLYTFDYIIKRIFPKFALTKKIYFILTRGQNRVFSKAEIFGRLYSCGFEIIDEKLIQEHLYFVARKTSPPLYPQNPTYGPFIKLERVGYRGKIIKVFKLRTMHPYAEYLQEYIYNTQGLETGGKFKSDFRISTSGHLLRMFWLDELPMLINLLRGQMKLVGVRPLSKHYFSLYTEELQQRRVRYKPGLIPPFYADKPETLEEIMESEIRYMDAYDKQPFLTDFKYFFRAGFNIIFKKYRSK